MATPPPPADFEELVEFIKRERAFDFTGYKRPSLMRRVQKRMDALEIASFEEYRRYLESREDEFVQLFNTILINVTSFFRDAPAWTYIAEEVVPRLVASREATEPIRGWSTGCATGEEAYTLGIILAEALGEEQFKTRVKIYATDVDEEALSVGRHGVYAARALGTVPEDLREKYFEPVDGRLAFKKEFRRSVIFGRHDLIQDPPISRIDVLVSRNTLMYFDAQTQRRILATFHFSLTDMGFLFLGKSEVLVTRTKLFVPVDLKHRVFAKVPRGELRERLPVALPTRPAVADEAAAPLLRDASFEAAPVAQIVVDRDGRLSLANAQARTMFGLTARDVGRPLKDLEVSYRPLELRSRIEEVHLTQLGLSIKGIDLSGVEPTTTVDVHLSPLIASDLTIAGVSVTFTDTSQLRQLEHELDVSRHDMEAAHGALQASNEELETTNEELQSTNEELETTNEELQSTNEELETMNEELQSTNAELEAINDELSQRTDELDDSNSFLEAILISLRGAVVVVDRDLTVQAWNRASEELWGLRAEEVAGQHLLNLDIGLPLAQLHVPLLKTLAGELPEEVSLDAVNRRGRPVLCRVSFAPLTTFSGDVRGAIVFAIAEKAPPG